MRVFRLALGTVYVAVAGDVSVHAKQNAEELAKLVIPLDRSSLELDMIETKLETIRSEIKPRAKASPRSLVLKDGSYVVYGDLFKNGGCFALFEVGLAEWADEEWQLRGLWNIAATWRPKGWKPSDADDLPIKPAVKPFELLDLSGDGIPEVIIAGEVEKYFQAHYLLRFEPKTRGLILLAFAMGKPALASARGKPAPASGMGKPRLTSAMGKAAPTSATGKPASPEEYARLYFNSGAQAIFEEWEYLSWSDDRLIRKASWRDEVPYNGIDPHFIIAEAVSDDGQSQTFRITDAKSDCDNESAYTITKDDRPYANLVIVWRNSSVKNVDLNPIEVEQAWLFETMTGLPRALYPLPRSTKKAHRLEDHATVRVTGKDLAIRKLSVPVQPR